MRLDPSVLAEVHNALARVEVNYDALILSSMPLACFEANRSAFEAYINPEERSQFLQQRLTEKGEGMQRDPNVPAEVHNALARIKVNDDLILSSMTLACLEDNRSAFAVYVNPEERRQFLQQRLTEEGEGMHSLEVRLSRGTVQGENGDAAKGSLDPAEYLDIYQCAAKSAAAEKSVLRRKICVVVLFLTMLPYNDVFPPFMLCLEFSP